MVLSKRNQTQKVHTVCFYFHGIPGKPRSAHQKADQCLAGAISRARGLAVKGQERIFENFPTLIVVTQELASVKTHQTGH